MDDDFIESVPAAGVLSPCNNVCTLDTATGWCLGCGRSGAEIAEWPEASDPRRQAILKILPERMRQLRDRP